MGRRIYFYVITAIMLTMILNLFSFETQSDNGVLSKVGLSGFLNNNLDADFSAADFFVQAFGVSGILVLASAGVGLVIAFAVGGQRENYIVLPFLTTVLAIFVGALWSTIGISSVYPDWIRIPVVMIMGPFTMGYILTMIEWFRGNQ